MKAASSHSGYSLENFDLDFAACLCTINSQPVPVISSLFFGRGRRTTGRSGQECYVLRSGWLGAELKYKISNLHLIFFYHRFGYHYNWKMCGGHLISLSHCIVVFLTSHFLKFKVIHTMSRVPWNIARSSWKVSRLGLGNVSRRQRIYFWTASLRPLMLPFIYWFFKLVMKL